MARSRISVLTGALVWGVTVWTASTADSLVPEPYQYGLASICGLFALVLIDRIRQRKLSVE